MELKRIRDKSPNANDKYFDSSYASLREMAVHPEVSHESREQAMGKQDKNNVPDKVGQFSSVGSFAKVSLGRAESRQKELFRIIQTAKEQLHATQQSLALAEQVKNLRKCATDAQSLWRVLQFKMPTIGCKMEAAKIHDFIAIVAKWMVSSAVPTRKCTFES